MYMDISEDKNNYINIYGPVPSRRLGFSLGIDIIPFKTCSLDCIYCQLGRTSKKIIWRKKYFDDFRGRYDRRHANFGYQAIPFKRQKSWYQNLLD